MTRLWWSTMIAAAVIGVAPYGVGASEPEQSAIDMKTMTVADLDKAGDASRAVKNYDQAVKYYQEGLRRDKKNARLYNKLGLAELSSGDTGSAKVAFEKAVKLNAKYADALNNLGAVYFKENRMGNAAKYFKKAVAMDETRATFHVNLGAAWFNQKKVDRAMKEYARALELDPEVLERTAKAGIVAQIASPEERAKFYFELAKIHAKRGDVESCLQCLRKAKENGYRDLPNVYRDEQFSQLWSNPQLHEVVPPPAAK